MPGFKDNEDAGRFRLVRPQTGETGIAPIGKTDDFSGLSLGFRYIGGLEDLETLTVEKERDPNKLFS